jgi:hypothetical protein
VACSNESGGGGGRPDPSLEATRNEEPLSRAAPASAAGVGHGLLDTEGHCRGGAGGEFGALVAKRRLRVRRARAFERFAAFMNTLVVANTNVVKTRGKLFSGGALLP